MTTEVTPVPPLMPPKNSSAAIVAIPKPPPGRLAEPVPHYQVLILRGTIIGAGVLGAFLFVRNSKLFTRLKHVSEIPESFYHKELQLKGVIRAVDSSGVIKVEHQPMISLPKFLRAPKRPSELLRVRLAGLDVSKEGISHMTKSLKLANRKVFFNAIKATANDSDSVDADVVVKKNLLGAVNLNVELVRKGLAGVRRLDDAAHAEALQTSGAYSRLVHRLLTSEQIAERRGLGVWERRGWVESLQSLPVAASSIARSSALYKLAALTGRLVYDLAMLLVAVMRHLYFFGVASVDYARHVSRRVGARVDALAHFYERQTSRWRGKALEPPTPKKP